MSKQRKKNEAPEKVAVLLIAGLIVISGMAFIWMSSDAASGDQVTASGTTYYIDPGSGSDTNSGTTKSSPWKTISKVNGASLSSGDTVLFKRGSTFSTALSITRSGSASSHITYADYGTGKKPVFDLGGASSSGISISASSITLRNLVINDTGKQGIMMESTTSGVYNVQILDCEVYNVGSNGILHTYGGGNITIKRARIDGVGNTGIALMGSYSRRLSDVVIQDCFLANSTSNDGITIHEGDSTPKTAAGSNFTLIGNHAQYNAEDGYDITTGNKILMLNNTSWKNRRSAIQLGHSAYDIEIVGHRSKDEGTESTSGATIVVWVDDVTIRDRVFYGGNYPTIFFFNTQSGSAPDNVTFENNYISWNGNRDIVWYDDPVTNMTWTNNIFNAGSTTARHIQFADSNYHPNHKSTTFANNVYYSSGTFKFWDSKDGEFTLSTFKSTYGQDSKALGSDPKLNSNLSPKWDSPVIDAGVDLGRGLDIEMNPIYGARDIGPVEYQPPYKIGSDSPEIKRALRLYNDGKFRYTGSATSNGGAKLVVKPDSGWPSLDWDDARDLVMDMDIQTWDKTGDQARSIKTTVPKTGVKYSYNMGDLISGSTYEVKVDGASIGKQKADSSGFITFTVTHKTTSTTITSAKTAGSDGDNTIGNPTTGDPFIFNISVSDNIAVKNVYVEYWFGSQSHINKTMSGTGPYTYSITVPNTTSSLHYIYHAVDTAGNWEQTKQVNLTILDNDRPLFGTDSSPTSVKAGTSLTFKTTVSDNIGVSAVHVEYWYGTGTKTNATMTGSGPYTYSVTVPNGSTSTLHYIFRSRDQANNWASTPRSDISVTTDSRPVFGTDSTPTKATTGETLTFSVGVTDDNAVGSVHVNYWFGSNAPTNTTMSGSGTYTKLISIPSGSTSTLYYVFKASDSSGNWANTLQSSIIISDNDRPSIGTDSTPSKIKAGSSLTFKVAASDNIGVTGTFVQHWSGTGAKTNSTMMGAGPYSFTMTAPSGVSSISYVFKAKDAAGNWVTSKTSSVAIDNRPQIGMDSTPSRATTGETLSFCVWVTDDNAVAGVHVVYWFGSGKAANSTMTGTGACTKQITIPSDSVASLNYLYKACDGSGNWATSVQHSIPVLDNDAPTLGTDSTPAKGTTGDPFTIKVSVNDNVKMGSAHVEYWFGNGSRTNASMDGSGTYTLLITIPSNSTDPLHYIVRASDSSGNWVSSPKTDVSVKDNDRPIFGDDKSKPSRNETKPGRSGDAGTIIPDIPMEISSNARWDQDLMVILTLTLIAGVLVAIAVLVAVKRTGKRDGMASEE